MAKVYYEDILVAEILTNQSFSIDEVLYLIGFDENEFCKEHGFDNIDYADFSLVV